MRLISKLAVVGLLVVIGCQGLLAQNDFDVRTPFTPKVIAAFARRNQTTNTSTTLFTPSSSGLYQVNAYITMVHAGSTGFWMVNVYWTDDAGSERVDCEINALSKPPFASDDCTFLIQATPNTPVSLTVAPDGNFADGTYSIFASVMKIAPSQ